MEGWHTKQRYLKISKEKESWLPPYKETSSEGTLPASNQALFVISLE